MMEELDKGVGRLLDTLDELELPVTRTCSLLGNGRRGGSGW